MLAEFKKNFDQQMLAQLYLRYTDLVYGVCMKYFKNAEIAKDAAMNIYQELLTKLQTNDVQNFKSWLYSHVMLILFIRRIVQRRSMRTLL